MMPLPTPAAQLKTFLAKYTPAMHAEMKAAHAKMRKLVPGAVEMVYDNWNGLVVGFGPTERASEAVLSLIVLPDHVTLCFLKGKKLPDPDKLLKGGGNVVRHHRLAALADLDKPPIRKLITLAIAQADPPFDTTARNKLVIKSVSAKQRPRRPSK
jgi:hypothetical protein